MYMYVFCIWVNTFNKNPQHFSYRFASCNIKKEKTNYNI